MSQDSNLKPLIQKLSSPLPEIQTRALNNIYTKITHQIIPRELLLSSPEFPGILMTWINDNKSKTQTLLKVIYLLSEYAKMEEGLILLKEYECLEFCEEFKNYLIQNQRAVDAYIQELDMIIRALTPLGRTQLQFQAKTQTHGIQAIKDSKPLPLKHTPKQHLQQELKFTIQNLPLPQPEQKKIFQLLMQAKYSPLETIFPTLSQLRNLVKFYSTQYFRCKNDLITYLSEISQANIYPQICIQIIHYLISTATKSQTSTTSPHLSTLITLPYSSQSKIPTTALHLNLPIKLFQLPQSLILLPKLTELYLHHPSTITKQYLISTAIIYKHSPQFLIGVLECLISSKDIQILQEFQNSYLDKIMTAVQEFVGKWPERSAKFMDVLPQKMWRKIKGLNKIAQYQQRQESYEWIKQYLPPNSFELSKNLHIMRQIIQNLKKGVQGIPCNPFPSIKLYLDILILLTVSLSRKDPLASYFSQAQHLFLSLVDQNCMKPLPGNIRMQIYKQILSTLKNTKNIINYPGLMIHKYEVMLTMFTSIEFTNSLIKNSLNCSKCLQTMLQIIISFINKNDFDKNKGKQKYKYFQHTLQIFYSLLYHPNSTIAMLAQQIVNKIPKHYDIWTIACKMFSSDHEIRKEIFTQIINRPQEAELTLKISKGQYKINKKPIKLSHQSIDNFLNMILNPSQSLPIRQSSISQFIQCLQRIQPNQLPNMDDAFLCLTEQIKNILSQNTQEISTFQQKTIGLYVTLILKLTIKFDEFGLEIWLTLLYKIKTVSVRVGLLTLLYVKVFQSPWVKQGFVKNWVSMHYPHLELFDMETEHAPCSPELSQPIEKESQPLPSSSTSNLPIYISLLTCPPNPQLIQSFEQSLLSSISPPSIPNLSKLSFVSKYNPFPAQSPSTMKILQHFIRTNPIVPDIDYQLCNILQKSTVQQTGNNCNIELYSISIKNLINNQTIQKVLKLTSDDISKYKALRIISQSKSIQYNSLNSYTILKLIQIVTTTIRSNTYNHLSFISLKLIHKFITENPHILQDHLNTLLTLIRTILTENKFTVCDLGLTLACYGKLLSILSTEDQNNNKNVNEGWQLASKMAIPVIQQVLTLLTSSTSNEILQGCCYSFLNEILVQTHLRTQNIFMNIINNHPNNIILHSTSILNHLQQNITIQSLTVMAEVFNFLQLFVSNNQNLINVLVNSTNILHTILNLLPKLCEQTPNPISCLSSLSPLLQALSLSSHQLIFKLNKTLLSLGPNPQYRLHYTLMSPIPLIVTHNHSLNSKYKQANYPKMVAHILSIWKQESKILEEIKVVEPLVTCLIDVKQYSCLSGLMIKSGTIRMLVAGCAQVGDKVKGWFKAAFELNLEKIKVNVKGKQSKQAMDKSRVKKSVYSKQESQANYKLVIQGLVFCTALFANTHSSRETDEIIEEFSSKFKETVLTCIQFIDQVYFLTETQKNDNLFQFWSKLIKNIFRNSSCSKILSNSIAQSNFECIHKMITRISQSNNNLMEVGKQLLVLGSICCNESIRSLIVKNKIIQSLMNMLITMDQNKVGKINYGFVYKSTCFLFCLAAFKQTNLKIQCEKKVMDLWAKMLSLQQSEVVEQKILDLLINLSTYKHSKPAFMACKQIHKACMYLLSQPQCQMKQKVLQLIYNILYKNAAGIKMYKQKQIIDLLSQLSVVQELAQMCSCLLEVLQNEE